ncbi:hypothetical protein OIO90_004761 [Microbotryomycetes sp. JL221]|nr:hypothetical protein OIO90_004761 [Microbotryomycetes sp. JL221]
MIGPLLRAQLTAMLTKKLLESPAFHRMVGATHNNIDRLSQSAYDALARAVAEGEAKMPTSTRNDTYTNASSTATSSSADSRPQTRPSRSSPSSPSYSTSSSSPQTSSPKTRPRWKDRPERDDTAAQAYKKEMERRQQEMQDLLNKLKARDSDDVGNKK